MRVGLCGVGCVSWAAWLWRVRVWSVRVGRVRAGRVSVLCMSNLCEFVLRSAEIRSVSRCRSGEGLEQDVAALLNTGVETPPWLEHAINSHPTNLAMSQQAALHWRGLSTSPEGTPVDGLHAGTLDHQKAVCAPQSAVSSQQSAVSSQQSAASSQQSAVSSQQPAVSSQKQAAGSRQQAAGSRQQQAAGSDSLPAA